MGGKGEGGGAIDPPLFASLVESLIKNGKLSRFLSKLLPHSHPTTILISELGDSVNNLTLFA